MEIIEETIILPLPDEELIQYREQGWRQVFPDDYKTFIMRFNGGKPDQIAFDCHDHGYALTRFLCILKDYKETDLGWYDINVVESQIGERLTANEDLFGVEVLPIAELFAGDYLCLDFRDDPSNPTICVWDHEGSDEFDPVTYKAANTFTEFLKLLH